MINRILDNLSKYPKLSSNLRISIDSTKHLECIPDLLDRALWCQLSNKPLSKEFTVYEAFMIDSWAGSNLKPTGFNELLVKELSDQLGIEFKRGING